MVESIKQNGQVQFNELSKYQIITLLLMWDATEVHRECRSFRDMLSRCYRSTPWNDGSPILYLHKDGDMVSEFRHPFSDMYPSEIESVMNALKK